MSDDSGEDFGGLGPTTPKVPAKRKVSRKPNSREAGPSSRPATTASHKKVVNPTSAEDSDVQLIEAFRDLQNAIDGDEDEDEVVQINPPPPPTRTNRKPSSTRAASAIVNGKSAAKGKGKMKDAPSKSAKKNAKPALVLDVDDLEVEDEMDLNNAAEDVARAINTATGYHGDNNAQAMTEQLRRADAHIEELKNQLEELFQVRNTEPEELLKQQQTQHQAHVQALESLIKELNAQIARKEPLLATGEGSLFNILTREEADKETHSLQQQIKSWKAEVEASSKLLKEKDDEIARLRESEKNLQIELHEEIERGRSIANKAVRAPPSASRGRNGGLLGSDDPKHAEVIKFYEDLTNLLVPVIKMQTGKYFDLDEWIFTCIYTYSDLNEPPTESKSLNFTLRLCQDLTNTELESVVSKDQLVSSVHYLPLQLDKESPEFVRKLGFLNNAFTFERDQLSLFLRTLYDTMAETLQGDDQEGSDGEERG